jgi:DNA modification methylase
VGGHAAQDEQVGQHIDHVGCLELAPDPDGQALIPDSVLRITRHKGRGIETEHPAVFPVALPEFLMRAYTDEGDVVFEPFGGSGTTILAGQRSGRRVFDDIATARSCSAH